MTNEEAIAIIENEKKCVNRANKNDYCNRDCYNCELVKTDTEILTALDLAIKALDQQPCDDVVSRQAVLYGLASIAKAKAKSDAQKALMGRVMFFTEQLPPVTPQQKYGKWILADEQNKEDVENDNYRFICSECQCSDIHAKGTIVPYCWKCGAKMQESEG